VYVKESSILAVSLSVSAVVTQITGLLRMISNRLLY